MNPKVFLEAVGHHRVPVGSTFVALPTQVHLTIALQIDMTDGLGWDCQLRDVEKDQRALLQPHQKHRSSKGASYGLRGA